MSRLFYLQLRYRPLLCLLRAPDSPAMRFMPVAGVRLGRRSLPSLRSAAGQLKEGSDRSRERSGPDAGSDLRGTRPAEDRNLK